MQDKASRPLIETLSMTLGTPYTDDPSTPKNIEIPLQVALPDGQLLHAAVALGGLPFHGQQQIAERIAAAWNAFAGVATSDISAPGQCLHQIQEPSAAEQAAWHAGLDKGRAQAAPAALAVPDGRSDFEAWATLSGYEGFERAMRGEGHYLSIALEELWQSWSESRAALVATPAEPESVVQLHPARAGRVYVAGPMTGLADFNFPAFNAAAAALRAKGWHVENPAEHGIVDGAEWADYLHYDLGRLATCAAIYLLPGWSQSRGATLEVHVGTTLGMTLFYAEGAEIYRQPIAAAAPVVLPEPDAVIREMMGLVDEWGMESHLRGEAELDAQHSEATQEEIDCAKDRASKERAAWNAIESKLRALLATATGLPAQAVLDYPWRARLLDGRDLVRDQQGFAEHPELPQLDEGMKPRAFFAALGVEMKHTMADDDLSMDEYDAMSDAENWSAWMPRPPIGDAWNLVAIFDTEDGPAAWWARAQKESQEAEPQAQIDAQDAESDYQRGYRHGYNRRDAEVQGALL